MEITITLPAYALDDELEVRKPGGTVTYTLKKEIKIYGSDQFKQIKQNGVVFLVSEGSITAVPEETKLSVDVQLGDAILFLEEVASNLEESRSK